MRFGIAALGIAVAWATSPVLLVIGAETAPSSRTVARTETFDADPQWEGRNNRQAPADPPWVTQDFGYLPAGAQTSAARDKSLGRASRGEIGGRVSASVRPAWYGMRIPSRGLGDALTASGTVRVTDAQSIMGWQTSANIFVGWFAARSEDLIWRPRNFVGFRLQSSNEPDGCLVELTYGTRAWQAGGAFVNAAGGFQQKNVRELESSELLRIAPDGVVRHWTFRYDPQGADGRGEMLFTFDGKETRLKLESGHQVIGAQMDHFGIFSPRIPGRHIEAYFGDLSVGGTEVDLSKDPQWEGMGNHDKFHDSAQYAYNDFGFSNTNFAGGKPGELGGRFFSCDPPEEEFKAWYGVPTGPLSLEHRLRASGKLAVREHSTDATFALGWFNAKKQGWPLENFVGAYFDSYSTEGRIIEPLYGTRAGTNDRGGNHLTFEPNRSYAWTLDYDPQGADGRGAITFAIDGRGATKTLRPGEKGKGAVLDRFGVFNMQWANSKWCDAYIDDLIYTAAGSP